MLLIDRVMDCGVLCVIFVVIFGRLSWIVCVISGVVMMKMMSSMSIMLISGVMLIFVIGVDVLWCLSLLNVMVVFLELVC